MVISQIQIDLGKRKLSVLRGYQEDLPKDTLTHVLNRDSLEKTLESALAQCSEQTRPLSLLMIDIDGFKDFNDTYCHPQGDEVLREVSKTMDSAVKGKGAVGRYGGEEFTVVLPNFDAKEASPVAERIRAEVEKLRLRNPKGEKSSLSVTISLGVATFPKDGMTKDELIGNADKALYQAKHGGRNRVIAYREESEWLSM